MLSSPESAAISRSLVIFKRAVSVLCVDESQTGKVCKGYC